MHAVEWYLLSLMKRMAEFYVWLDEKYGWILCMTSLHNLHPKWVACRNLVTYSYTHAKCARTYKDMHTYAHTHTHKRKKHTYIHTQIRKNYTSSKRTPTQVRTHIQRSTFANADTSRNFIAPLQSDQKPQAASKPNGIRETRHASSAPSSQYRYARYAVSAATVGEELNCSTWFKFSKEEGDLKKKRTFHAPGTWVCVCVCIQMCMYAWECGKLIYHVSCSCICVRIVCMCICMCKCNVCVCV